MHPLQDYLAALSQIRASGAAVKETSYYSALEHLLNEVGKSLKPWVRAVSQLQNTGAGSPDFGLFTKEQFQKRADAEPLQGQLPARGVVEVKAVADDSWLTAKGKQVSKYWDKYRLVLVTNYRDFLLVGEDANGKAIVLETFRLADDEQSFWQLTAHPHKAPTVQSDRLVDFLKRVLLHAAPLADPKDVAWFLASYAREARARIDARPDLPALASLRKGLESTLGVRFEKEEGDHFFRSTLVQTLFYGVFSAWVLWHRLGPAAGERFDWKKAGWTLQVPMIRALFDQVAHPSKLKALGLVEVLDWVNSVLDRVARDAFFARFAEGEAVQYFYEPFLEAFDPELRKKLGVWYTPPEIVRYMVARVDRVLREELHLADGLADDKVVILDPCCGTGTFLVEVLRVIHAGLKERGLGAATGAHLKRAAIERVFGFELMPAPFVVAHLQLGLLLASLGAPLALEDDDKQQRLGVHLTNALTGWAPPDEEGKKRMTQLSMDFPEFAAEHDAAEVVKREKKILVILGNPPYNAFAGVAQEEEADLVRPYKEGLNKPVAQGGWGIKKFNLDDLYIRFFRLAERQVAERGGRGVVCFISNHSWISESSFVVLRQHLLRSFDDFWIENMHGNRKISEYAPDGRTSETVFAMCGFSPGIQQGVAISLWVKRDGAKEGSARIRFRDDLTAAKAAERRADLLASLDAQDFATHYSHATPCLENRYGFRPRSLSEDYPDWPALTQLCAQPPINGLMEKRAGALIDIDRAALESRMQAYFDATLEMKAVRALHAGLAVDAARFDAAKARVKVLAQETYLPDRMRRYLVRPFDTRWAYYTPVRPLWNEPRPRLWEQQFEGNCFLLTRPAGVANPEGMPICFTPCLGDNDAQRGHAYYFPFRLRVESDVPPDSANHDLFGHQGIPEPTIVANLSAGARGYLESLGLPDPDNGEADGLPVHALIWWHALAIGCSPAYLTEHADGIRGDWPRIPLPATAAALIASATLGRELAALLDTESTVAGVTAGKPRAELATVAVPATAGNIALDEDEHLKLTAGWGHAGKGSVTMPGKGKLDSRPRRDDERVAGDGALGDETRDVWLNNACYWRNVPRPVWEYTIGGYQVMKKWLSYREFALLGRALTLDEAREVTHMARRLAALVLLQGKLDANYRAVVDAAFDWGSVA